MTDLTYLLIAVAIYFAAMLAIGVYAARRTKSHEDYVLGGRVLHPATAALSAGAADMSGWLLMGLPGAVYAAGLIEAWIAIGLTIGAWLNWKLVAPRLRAYTEVASDSITIPSFFENRLRDRSRLLRITSSVIIIVFFTLYISSGMVAGGKFFETAFDGEYLSGLIIVGGITLAYTLFGGFLAATLTDVAQGVMIMCALIAVPIIAVVSLGGPGEVFATVERIDPAHLSMLGGEGLDGAAIISIVSALAWGLGYFGQPHIITRFMALRSPAAATAGRRIGMSWMVLSLLGAVVSGLVGLAYVTRNGIALDDPEKIVLAMSQILFHPLVAGFVLSAVLAAIMSTMSSQLVVTSAAFIEDLYRIAKRDAKPETLRLLGRVLVFIIAVVALVLAITPNDTILGLVSFAWAGFGASFGPVILLSLFWRRLTNWGALAAMVVGAATVFIWKALDTPLYELLPAFVVAVVVGIVVSLFTPAPDADVDAEFAEVEEMVTGSSRA